jgi:hypothetical protein
VGVYLRDEGWVRLPGQRAFLSAIQLVNMKKTFVSKAKVKVFPQKGGWVYLPIKQTYQELDMKKPRWGLVPATITIGHTTWTKSLLPFGDGTLFIALNAKVRKAEGIKIGDVVTAHFSLF